MRRAPAILAFIVAAVLAPSGGARAGDAATAREILRLSGVKQGLCLHLGCGRSRSAGLTAELAAGSSMLVHGLAYNDDSAARARKGVASRAVAGRAMVEKVAPGPLPYLRDLASLVVVEDLAALARVGVNRDELMRVIAPGGVLCVRSGRRWKKTVKPRPEEMDDWTHPRHGADGNMVSVDRLVKFPIGFRWIDGLPVNVNRWAACRAWVISEGRCFTLSANEMENIGPRRGRDQWLAARDAFNGLPLWKINCGTSDNGAQLNWRNAGALVAGGGRVYAARKDKKIIAVDAATGKVVVTIPTTHQAERLALLEGVRAGRRGRSRSTRPTATACGRRGSRSRRPARSRPSMRRRERGSGRCPSRATCSPPRTAWSTR